MKCVYTAIVLTSVFSMFALGQEEKKHRLKVVEITSEAQETPRFQINGPKSKKVDPRNWIEIEVEIEVVKTLDPAEFISELEAHWYAVIKDKFAKEEPRKLVRLHGSARFKNVRLAEKKFFLSAYIDPDTVERLTGEDRLSEKDIEGFAVIISGPEVIDGEAYAADLELATAEEKSLWWKKWDKRTIDGAIIPKSKTPFSQIWTDR